MQIRRRTPFETFSAVERQFQSMLDQVGGWRWLDVGTWKPTTDIYTEDDTLFVRAELPGIAPEDLTVELEGSVLHIAGEKLEEHEIEEADRSLRERRFGTFERDIVVPDGVDASRIEARYANGVLTVSLPIEKAEREEVRKVTIDVATAQPVG